MSKMERKRQTSVSDFMQALHKPWTVEAVNKKKRERLKTSGEKYIFEEITEQDVHASQDLHKDKAL